jgi:PAS domain S-box-containing protein
MNDSNSGTSRKGRILVVDDKPANLRLLTKLLNDHGYTVHAANSGELVIQFLRTTIPDLVLLDIRMPEMDGYQVCERLKADSRTADIPVIFVSAADEALDKVRAFGCGGVDYVVKPFQEEEVLARVATHLSLRRLQKHLGDLVDERTAELYKAKEELAVSHQLLQRIIDNSAALIFVKDLDGRYMLVNSRFEQLLGVSAQGVIGKTDAEVLSAEVAAALGGADRDVAESGTTIEAEQTMRLPDGTHTYISIKSPLCDEDGRIYAVCTTFTDITERVNAETAIRQINDMLERRLAERSSDARHPMKDDVA